MAESEIATPVVDGTKLATWKIGDKDYPRNVITDEAGLTVDLATTEDIEALSAKLPSALGVGGGLKIEGVDTEYETVAASQTAQVLGGSGTTGDYLGGLLVIPASTSPGAVTILDNATAIPVFVGGATSVSNLVPFFVPIQARSVSGPWKVTTGASVSVIATGNFS